MLNELFFNGFLKEAGIAPAMKLSTGADFLKKINSKLKTPIVSGQVGKVTSGVKPSSYNVLSKQAVSPSQVAAQNASRATTEAAPLSGHTQQAIKSTTNAPGLRKEHVGDHGVFSN